MDGATAQTIPAARSGEVFFQAVDRKFYGGLRLAASFARVFGLGGANRSTSSIFTVTANREFREGRGEWEAQLGYLAAKDDKMGHTSQLSANDRRALAAFLETL